MPTCRRQTNTPPPSWARSGGLQQVLLRVQQVLLRVQQVLLRVRSLRGSGLRTSGLVVGEESHSAAEGNLSLERALHNRWFSQNQTADNGLTLLPTLM